MRNSLRTVYIKKFPKRRVFRYDNGYWSASSIKRRSSGIKFGNYIDRVKQVREWKLGYRVSGHMTKAQKKRVKNLCEEFIDKYRKDRVDRIDELVRLLEK